MADLPIEYEVASGVATIWLNRPHVRNAYDLETLLELRRAVARAEADADAAAVVVRGRGDSFCAGGDMSLLDGGRSWLELSRHVESVFRRLAECAKVTIAAVHGWTVGGGFELMLACDLAVAAEDARIGDFHIRNGLFAGGGTMHRLPRLVGLRRTRELMLSGDVLDGRQAREWGIVNDVAPPDKLDALVERFAARFTDKSPTVTRLTKLALSRALDADTETLALLEAMASGAVAATADAQEGVAAFLAGRAPAWGPLHPPLDDGG
jgi:enoyl-CoA hydratase/carnithine racemase